MTGTEGRDFGYAKEYRVERLWREVRLLRLAPSPRTW
jgi:alkylation response protein AidB-like acyl-CoA dehydrogenase